MIVLCFVCDGDGFYPLYSPDHSNEDLDPLEQRCVICELCHGSGILLINLTNLGIDI